MTFARFFGLGFVIAILTAFLELVFLNVLNPEALGIKILFWVLLGVVSIALVRRLGVLQYLESFFVILSWLVFSLIVDALFTQQFVAAGFWTNVAVWIGRLVSALAILFFHKKRHVEIRKELAKK